MGSIKQKLRYLPAGLIIAGGLALGGAALVPHDAMGQADQQNAVQEAKRSLASETVAPAPKPVPVETPAPVEAPVPVAVDPNVDDLTQLAEGEVFGIIRIPALGADWEKTIAQGTSPAVLDTMQTGHYRSTENPGQLGNFAVAGHNNTGGTVFDRIPELKVGDEIIVETASMRYVYTFRNSEIITPDKNNILLPVPWQQGVEPTEAIMTMVTCWPVDSWNERWIAYSVLESATPK